jgi:hypothetical protein
MEFYILIKYKLLLVGTNRLVDYELMIIINLCHVKFN